MERPLSILMYHYVRELEHSRFPSIKGLNVQQFKGQLEYMQKYYAFVTVEDLIDALEDGGGRLPRNAAILTFDDGYIDHFTNVFPILYQKGIQGCFFPIGRAVAEHRVSDVNKLHFMLASISDNTDLVREVFSMLDELRLENGLESNEYYYQTFSQAQNRYDPPEVIFTKILLQKGLAEKPRAEITDKLFRKYVTCDEEAFARELYMSADQLKSMIKAGMYVGSHSYNHVWLDSVSSATQAADIEASLQFLSELGCDMAHWSFTHPYGAHNESLISLLKARDCKFAMTDRPGISDLNNENHFTLLRLDTNDLPKDGKAAPNEWTLRVINSGQTIK